jgi:hypothetical protein
MADAFGSRGRGLDSKPYSEPVFKHAKRQGVVAKVERERGVRIVELDPALGWYSLDPASLPIALVAGMRRKIGGRLAPASRDRLRVPVN